MENSVEIHLDEEEQFQNLISPVVFFSFYICLGKTGFSEGI